MEVGANKFYARRKPLKTCFPVNNILSDASSSSEDEEITKESSKKKKRESQMVVVEDEDIFQEILSDSSEGRWPRRKKDVNDNENMVIPPSDKSSTPSEPIAVKNVVKRRVVKSVITADRYAAFDHHQRPVCPLRSGSRIPKASRKCLFAGTSGSDVPANKKTRVMPSKRAAQLVQAASGKEDEGPFPTASHHGVSKLPDILTASCKSSVASPAGNGRSSTIMSPKMSTPSSSARPMISPGLSPVPWSPETVKNDSSFITRKMMSPLATRLIDQRIAYEASCGTGSSMREPVRGSSNPSRSNKSIQHSEIDDTNKENQVSLSKFAKPASDKSTGRKSECFKNYKEVQPKVSESSSKSQEKERGKLSDMNNNKNDTCSQTQFPSPPVLRSPSNCESKPARHTDTEKNRNLVPKKHLNEKVSLLNDSLPSVSQTVSDSQAMRQITTDPDQYCCDLSGNVAMGGTDSEHCTSDLEMHPSKLPTKPVEEKSTSTVNSRVWSTKNQLGSSNNNLPPPHVSLSLSKFAKPASDKSTGRKSECCKNYKEVQPTVSETSSKSQEKEREKLSDMNNNKNDTCSQTQFPSPPVLRSSSNRESKPARHTDTGKNRGLVPNKHPNGKVSLLNNIDSLPSGNSELSRANKKPLRANAASMGEKMIHDEIESSASMRCIKLPSVSQTLSDCQAKRQISTDPDLYCCDLSGNVSMGGIDSEHFTSDLEMHPSKLPTKPVEEKPASTVNIRVLSPKNQLGSSNNSLPSPPVSLSVSKSAKPASDKRTGRNRNLEVENVSNPRACLMNGEELPTVHSKILNKTRKSLRGNTTAMGKEIICDQMENNSNFEDVSLALRLAASSKCINSAGSKSLYSVTKNVARKSAQTGKKRDCLEQGNQITDSTHKKGSSPSVSETPISAGNPSSATCVPTSHPPSRSAAQSVGKSTKLKNLDTNRNASESSAGHCRASPVNYSGDADISMSDEEETPNWRSGDLQEILLPEVQNLTVPASVRSPVEYFSFFFDDTLIDMIVRETNRYSLQVRGKCLDVMKEEIRAFLGILIYTGVCKLPAVVDYWAAPTSVHQVSDVMSRKRYQDIHRLIHFHDNEEEGTDRLLKVRPLLDHMKMKCQQLEKENKLSVDERMQGYKGTRAGNIRQYLPDKPSHKWGFKIFVLAGKSGMTYNFIVYCGADTFALEPLSKEERNLGVGASAVIALCKSIQHPEVTTITFDNWYTGLPLIRYLKNKMNLHSIGTINRNRTEGCPLTDQKEMMKKGRGSYEGQVHKDAVIIIQWADNKAVCVATSFAGIEPLGTVKRYCKEAKRKVDVPCPRAIALYNSTMGGVDLGDMFMALYDIPTRARRWYFPLFGYTIELALTNSWLLYKRDCELLGHKNKLKTSKDFRLAVSQALRAGTQRSKGRPSVNNCLTKKRISRPMNARPDVAVRLDGFNHWPEYCTKGRCRYCKSGFCRIKCTKCDMKLCMVPDRNCFVQFHLDQSANTHSILQNSGGEGSADEPDDECDMFAD